MTTSLTPAETAAALRALADAIELCPAVPVSPNVYLSIPGYCTADEPDRVAAVDALAATVEVTAAPGPLSSGSPVWQHRAGGDRNGLGIQIWTSIDAPPRRCACGAACQHPNPVTAAA